MLLLQLNCNSASGIGNFFHIYLSILDVEAIYNFITTPDLDPELLIKKRTGEFKNLYHNINYF